MIDPKTASSTEAEEQDSPPAQALSESDTAIARVLEDLIDILISRGVIQFTDLPEAAQGKLLNRRQTRAMLKDSLQLLPGDGDGGLL
jgi:hypothetical protein